MLFTADELAAGSLAAIRYARRAQPGMAALVLARLRLRDDFSFEKLPISKAPPPFCVPKLF